VKRYLIEFNTEDDKNVANLIGALLNGGNATSLKVQVFTEEELESGDANPRTKTGKPKLTERREQVFKLKQRGFANTAIAKKLDVAANTVYNDLTYWRNEGYDI
jgi:DNA-binding NarL/FixJ family response regulator